MALRVARVDVGGRDGRAGLRLHHVEHGPEPREAVAVVAAASCHHLRHEGARGPPPVEVALDCGSCLPRWRSGFSLLDPLAKCWNSVQPRLARMRSAVSSQPLPGWRLCSSRRASAPLASHASWARAHLRLSSHARGLALLAPGDSSHE